MYAECAGRILETGSAVSGLKVGQKVVIESATPCGKCDNCRNTRLELCFDIQMRIRDCLSEINSFLIDKFRFFESERESKFANATTYQAAYPHHVGRRRPRDARNRG